MDVDDVEAPLAEERAHAAAQAGADRVQRLGPVTPARHVEPDGGAHADDLERRLWHRHRVVLHRRGLQHAAGHDGHLVP
jgi:hypothetical protein